MLLFVYGVGLFCYIVVFFLFVYETEFLCAALAVLELTLNTLIMSSRSTWAIRDPAKNRAKIKESASEEKWSNINKYPEYVA